MTNLNQYLEQNPIKTLTACALLITLSAMTTFDAYRAIEDRYCVDSLGIGKALKTGTSPHCQALYSFTEDELNQAITDVGSRSMVINALKEITK